MLSSAGELTSSEPLPNFSASFSRGIDFESESSVDISGSSPERYTPEPVVRPVRERKAPAAASKVGAKRGRKPNKRASPIKQQKKENVKEDIVKQAMRCSNINFDTDEEMSPSNSSQVSLNHFTEIAQAILSQKGGNIVETQDNPAYIDSNEDNNNTEGGKTVEGGKCELDTILTFQYTAALSTSKQHQVSKSEPVTLAVMMWDLWWEYFELFNREIREK